MCYTSGLRDRGFEVLNAFGCTCSAEQIHEQVSGLTSETHLMSSTTIVHGVGQLIMQTSTKSLQNTSSGAKKMLNHNWPS